MRTRASQGPPSTDASEPRYALTGGSAPAVAVVVAQVAHDVGVLQDLGGGSPAGGGADEASGRG